MRERKWSHAQPGHLLFGYKVDGRIEDVIGEIERLPSGAWRWSLPDGRYGEEPGCLLAIGAANVALGVTKP